MATNPSATVPAGAAVSLMDASGQIYRRVINIGRTSDGVAWLSYMGTAAVGAPGSFPLGPYGNTRGFPSSEEFNSLSTPISRGYVIIPGGTLSAISDGGTSGTAGAILTIEFI